MISQKFFVILFLGAGLVLSGVFWYQGSRESEGGASPPRVFPDAEFRTANGETIAMRKFKGTPIVVNVWATWCPYCRKEIPDFVVLQKEVGDAFRVILVNRGESVDTATRYLETVSGFASTTAVLYDHHDSFYASIGGFSMPETLFVNKEGIIRYHKRGFMGLEEMRRRAEDAFGISR